MGRKISDCVLVAGGAGFVGSNLIKRLLSYGRRVHCVDNFSTGFQTAIAEFETHRQFKSFRGDVTDSQFMSTFEDNDYSEIYNLACPTGVPNIAPLGEAMLLTSSMGSLNLLRLARHSEAKYLFTSTAEIYGDPEVVPQNETYNGNVDPVGPRSAYEEGKRFGEALTAHFAKKYDLSYKMLKYFNPWLRQSYLTNPDKKKYELTIPKAGYNETYFEDMSGYEKMKNGDDSVKYYNTKELLEK